MIAPLSKGFALIGPSHRSCAALSSRFYSQSTLSSVSSNSTPYFIPRNTLGSLPVYSDIRNGGTRYLVLVKNVRGNINSLRDDLASSLFQPGSEQAARLKAEVKRSDTLVVTGGRWKHDVMDWLRRKGF
ncbi:uncharacterized protein FOMMEDRAFT_166101 [Fomitiporia mediterranea MF3/22]|uniref:uncharacterized protein n=1 Tax=Fomitiporia mediterranea (strain MF3/22) TaxID=694068 RepID=UPI0004408129|nr:uncharacterized protein FOMMEDRAFT_166101 [Fomitiporia mediterranea MF3/22]EJD05756.1 hypothetical protein FOMMEDRAFT_166101 [Fomitiporia mediterranea MF3/22]